MSKPAEILLLSDHKERVQQWARLLTGPDTSLWQGIAALRPETLLDVIVTDRDIASDLAPGGRWAARLAIGETGVVRIAHDGVADVRLPADCTPAELRLACRLLTQVVRLRRQANRQRRVHRVLTQLAMSDPLTGLPNRRAWEEQLAACDLNQQANSFDLCLAVLDLDHFKLVNERDGHVRGDEVLRQVGRQLAAVENIFAARLGGDEFGLIVTGLDPSAAVKSLEGLRISACAACGLAITASMGAACGGIADGAEELFRTADQALSRAKLEGRDRLVVAPAVCGAPCC